MKRWFRNCWPGLLLIVGSCCLIYQPSLQGENPLQPKPDAAFSDGSAQPAPPRGVTIDGTVDRVIDGDTIIVRTAFEYRVRLLDCWAPESRTTDAAEKVKGLKAKARLTSLSSGKPVRVFVPIQHGDLSTLITLGRVLGRVWLLQDGIPESEELSRIMVREKLATVRKQE